MLYVLARWVDDAKGKATRKTDRAPNPKQPYLMKARNRSQTTRVAGTRQTRTRDCALLDGQYHSRSETIP